jgi:hypothetical protein
VFGLAAAGETRATGRLAAVLALTEIADQFGLSPESMATIAVLQTRQAQTPATAMAPPPPVGWVDVRMYRFPQIPHYMRNARARDYADNAS